MTAAIVEQARAWLGAEARVLSRRDGEQARLWQLSSPRGRAWIKVHRHAANATRERAALSAVAPTCGADVPRVLTALAPDALLLTEVAGTPVARLDATRRRVVWVRLRAWLDELTVVPVADDPVDPAEAYAARFAGWRARADLDGASLDELDAAFDADVFTGAGRRLCHRDLSPDNLRLADDARLGVIDFGQSRPDVWPCDLAKLWADADVTDDDRAALAQGLAADDLGRLHAAVLLHGLATAAWGRMHHDGRRRREGLRILRDHLGRDHRGRDHLRDAAR